MNYIFLDIDGVLNCEEYVLNVCDRSDKDKRWLSKDRILLLVKLVKETNSKIILSSSWRFGLTENLEPKRADSDVACLCMAFDKLGIQLSGMTDRDCDLAEPDLNGSVWKRPFLIKKYINDHLLSSDKFIIFDDEDINMSKLFGQRFIKTNFYGQGLTQDHCDKAKLLLN